MKKQIIELLQISNVSYYRWRKSPKREGDNKPPKIFDLLEKYFTEQELQEFLDSGEISKFEILEEFKALLQGSKFDYLAFVTKYLKHSNEFDFFTDFYFRFLVYIGNLRNQPIDSDIEFQNIFQLNDALPSFLINNSFAHLSELEMYQLQFKVRQINRMDQNTTNLILLSISNDFLSFMQPTMGTISDDNRKLSVLHSLMFCIYKYHPNLDYEGKVKLLGRVLGVDGSMVFEVFEKITWKTAEAEYGKIVESIKQVK